MPDLTACYFCGTAETAEAGPAVPPSLDPPAAVQQSVVLCPTCREKLTAVLEPVFEAGVADPSTGPGAAAGDDRSRPDTTADPGAANDDTGGDGTPAGSGGDDRRDADDPEAVDPFAFGAPDDEGGDDATPDDTAVDTTADGAAADDPAAADQRDGTDSDAEGGITIDRVPGPGEGADGGDDVGGANGTAAADGDPGTDAAGEDPAATGDPPDEYYTVLRFLENREFPVDRAEVRTVVAGAYDLGEREVAEILDAAVRRGVFVEVDGTLARSREQL